MENNSFKTKKKQAGNIENNSFIHGLLVTLCFFIWAVEQLIQWLTPTF